MSPTSFIRIASPVLLNEEKAKEKRKKEITDNVNARFETPTPHLPLFPILIFKFHLINNFFFLPTLSNSIDWGLLGFYFSPITHYRNPVSFDNCFSSPCSWPRFYTVFSIFFNLLRWISNKNLILNCCFLSLKESFRAESRFLFWHVSVWFVGWLFLFWSVYCLIIKNHITLLKDLSGLSHDKKKKSCHFWVKILVIIW